MSSTWCRRGVFADELLAAAAEPEVEPPGMERLEETELLDDGQRCAGGEPGEVDGVAHGAGDVGPGTDRDEVEHRQGDVSHRILRFDSGSEQGNRC
jgi:hypothetical protein